jgi:hypothetical protein
LSGAHATLVAKQTGDRITRICLSTYTSLTLFGSTAIVGHWKVDQCWIRIDDNLQRLMNRRRIATGSIAIKLRYNSGGGNSTSFVIVIAVAVP